MNLFRGAVAAGASVLRGRTLPEPLTGGTSMGGMAKDSEVATGVGVVPGASRAAMSPADRLCDAGV
jgi:hypothetical protein